MPGFTPYGGYSAEPGYTGGSLLDYAKNVAGNNSVQSGIKANQEALAIGNALGGGFPQVGGGQVQFTQPNAGGGFNLSGFGGPNIYAAALNQAGQFSPTGTPGFPMSHGSQAPGFGGSFFPNSGFNGFNQVAFGSGGFGGNSRGFGGGGFGGAGGGFGGGFGGGNAPGPNQGFMSRFGGAANFANLFNQQAGGQAGQGGGFRDAGGQSGISGVSAGNPSSFGGAPSFSSGGFGTFSPSGFQQPGVNFQNPFNQLMSSLQGNQARDELAISRGANRGFQTGETAGRGADSFNFNAVGGNAGVRPNPFTTPGANRQTGDANRFPTGAGFRAAVPPEGGATLATNNQPPGFRTQDPNAGRFQAGGFLRGPEDAQFLLDSGIIDQAMFDRILPIANKNASLSGPGTVGVPEGSTLPGGFTSFGPSQEGRFFTDSINTSKGGSQLASNDFNPGQPRDPGRGTPGPQFGVGGRPHNPFDPANHPQGGGILQTDPNVFGGGAPQGQFSAFGGGSQLAQQGGGAPPPPDPNAGNPNASPGFQVGSGVLPGIRQPFSDAGFGTGGFAPNPFNNFGGSNLAQGGAGQGFQGGFTQRGRFDDAGNASLNQLLSMIAPGFAQNIPGGIASDSDFFGQQAGMFAGDPAQLPGEAGPNLLGFAANLTFNRALQQAGLTGAGNDIATAATNRLAGGPAVAGTEQLLNTLNQNPFTTSSDALQGEIEGLITRRSAENEAATSAGLQDRLSASGLGGGESELLKASSAFGSRARLADDLAEARINQALRRQSDITTGLGSFARGGDTLSSQVFNPSMQLAQFLRGGAANPLADSFTEQVRDLGIAAIEDELRENADDSALQRFLSILDSTGGFISSLQGGR